MTSKTHVFAVAVEDYLDSTIDKVIYAENNAQEFVKAWQSLGAAQTDCVFQILVDCQFR